MHSISTGFSSREAHHRSRALADEDRTIDARTSNVSRSVHSTRRGEINPFTTADTPRRQQTGNSDLIAFRGTNSLRTHGGTRYTATVSAVPRTASSNFTRGERHRSTKNWRADARNAEDPHGNGRRAKTRCQWGYTTLRSVDEGSTIQPPDTRSQCSRNRLIQRGVGASHLNFVTQSRKEVECHHIIRASVTP